MFKEYDVVIAKRDLADVPFKSRGTVLIVFKNSNQYEVEFVDEEGNTLSVLTVAGADLELWRK
jgi:hypothetical protein